jgi:hypothetical protein
MDLVGVPDAFTGEKLFEREYQCYGARLPPRDTTQVRISPSKACSKISFPRTLLSLPILFKVGGEGGKNPGRLWSPFFSSTRWIPEVLIYQWYSKKRSQFRKGGKNHFSIPTRRFIPLFYNEERLQDHLPRPLSIVPHPYLEQCELHFPAIAPERRSK